MVQFLGGERQRECDDVFGMGGGGGERGRFLGIGGARMSVRMSD